MTFSVHLQASSEVWDSLKETEQAPKKSQKRLEVIRLNKKLTLHHVGFPAAVSSDLVDFWAMCREIKTKYRSKLFLQCFPKPS